MFSQAMMVQTATQRTFAVFMMVALVFGPFYKGMSAEAVNQENEQPKVTVCHFNNGNGYTANTVSISSTGDLSGGHGDHENDIIPPYEYTDDQNQVQNVPGQNWTDDNQTIWADGFCNGEVTPVVCEVGFTGVYPNCIPIVTTCENDGALNYGEAGECVFDQPATTTNECEFEGHKYDMSGRPLANWTIGLMKLVGSAEGTSSYDLVAGTTDSDGYYCLEWDGYTNTPTNLPEPHSFLYRVYEVLQKGWNNISVEMGTKAANESSQLTVVDDSQILTENGRTSVQVGETNGYVYADAAYHVDFYNKQDQTSDESDSYQLFGTVWNDTDKDDDIDEGEDDLSGWVVRAVNASNTEEVYSTTTDSNGDYELNVHAGTWIISELTEDGWVLLSLADGDGTYTVTVPAVQTVTLLDWLIPTAQAATIDSFGPYNFGNIVATTSTTTTTTTTTSRHHGHSSGSVLGASLTRAPEGQVLGDATTTLPVGAPNTGAGGTSPAESLTLSAILVTRISTRKSK